LAALILAFQAFGSSIRSAFMLIMKTILLDADIGVKYYLLMSNNERILELEEMIREVYERSRIHEAWALGLSTNELRMKEREVEQYVEPYRKEIASLKRAK
jgi:hypothetical protein